MKDNFDRILALDYGEKRIGVAITDPLQMFAYPLTTLSNDPKIRVSIKKIFNEYQIIKVILGYPLKEDGEKTKFTSKVDEFHKILKTLFDGEIILQDERYSSSIAEERIIQSVPSKKKRRNKALIDQNAAAVILEDYLGSK